MSATCEHCTHDWHGLRCRHEVVERDGWFLTRRTCSCEGDPAR